MEVLESLNAHEREQLERETRAVGHLLAITLRDALDHYQTLWRVLSGADSATLVQLQANALEESLRLVRINRGAEPYLGVCEAFGISREPMEIARDLGRDLAFACLALLELQVDDRVRSLAVEAIVPPPTFFTARAEAHVLAEWLQARERDHG
jgi:hypothetical protein